MATPVVRNIFEIATEEIDREIDSFIQSLTEKKAELIANIASLKTEYNNVCKQKQNDVSELNTLKFKTEELGQNNLVDIQRKILDEIQTGIDKLSLECDAPPDFEIKIDWGQYCDYHFRTFINAIEIVKVNETNENAVIHDSYSASAHFDDEASYNETGDDEDNNGGNWGERVRDNEGSVTSEHLFGYRYEEREKSFQTGKFRNPSKRGSYPERYQKINYNNESRRGFRGSRRYPPTERDYSGYNYNESQWRSRSSRDYYRSRRSKRTPYHEPYKEKNNYYSDYT